MRGARGRCESAPLLPHAPRLLGGTLHAAARAAPAPTARSCRSRRPAPPGPGHAAQRAALEGAHTSLRVGLGLPLLSLSPLPTPCLLRTAAVPAVQGLGRQRAERHPAPAPLRRPAQAGASQSEGHPIPVWLPACQAYSYTTCQPMGSRMQGLLWPLPHRPGLLMLLNVPSPCLRPAAATLQPHNGQPAWRMGGVAGERFCCCRHAVLRCAMLCCAACLASG